MLTPLWVSTEIRNQCLARQGKISLALSTKHSRLLLLVKCSVSNQALHSPDNRKVLPLHTPFVNSKAHLSFGTVSVLFSSLLKKNFFWSLTVNAQIMRCWTKLVSLAYKASTLTPGLSSPALPSLLHWELQLNC